MKKINLLDGFIYESATYEFPAGANTINGKLYIDKALSQDVSTEG